MSDTAIGPAPHASKTELPLLTGRRLLLLLALASVLGFRLWLYFSAPDQPSDFDFLYAAAARLISGQNPYPPGTTWFPYPLPAVLLAVSFTTIPLQLARVVFDVLAGWALAFALWRYRGPYALGALLSGAYVFAVAHGQTTPLVVAAILVPALGFLLAVRPNTSAALWIARPSWTAIAAAAAFLLLSLAVAPSWPRDWWMALPQDVSQLKPPIMRPFGFILLLAAFRWRSPEGRLILALAFVPQSTLPYELLALALVPTNLIEMAIYAAGCWITVAAAERLNVAQGLGEWTIAGWPLTVCAVYVPMLYLTLRRGKSAQKVLQLTRERRRAHRLPDEDLRVDISSEPGGWVTVKVTHLPSQVWVSERGTSRDQVVRKAHDKLAALLAGTSRLAKPA
jgi:hypothetical protein